MLGQWQTFLFSYKAPLYKQYLLPLNYMKWDLKRKHMGWEKLKLVYFTDYSLYFSMYWTIFRWLISIHFLNHAGQNSFNNNLWPVQKVPSFPWCLKKQLRCRSVRDARTSSKPPCLGAEEVGPPCWATPRSMLRFSSCSHPQLAAGVYFVTVFASPVSWNVESRMADFNSFYF